MSQALLASTKSSLAALLAVGILFAVAVSPALADPCAIACRSQHNACRMAAKLLFTPRCDAQLQACISQCFAAGRFNRGAREDREPREFRDRDRDRRGPPEMRAPPDAGGGGGPGPERGPGRNFREFRNQDFHDPAGPRWLGGPLRWTRFR
ncbi:MAG: hypothetical protein QM780_11525 [Hyphomicrobium sp.]|uniref:hypothetical protein n=1 Tax=Hyphomicrobium sp. TaxID=82 RepID=UPI0039E37A10